MKTILRVTHQTDQLTSISRCSFEGCWEMIGREGVGGEENCSILDVCLVAIALSNQLTERPKWCRRCQISFMLLRRTASLFPMKSLKINCSQCLSPNHILANKNIFCSTRNKKNSVPKRDQHLVMLKQAKRNSHFLSSVANSFLLKSFRTLNLSGAVTIRCKSSTRRLRMTYDRDRLGRLQSHLHNSIVCVIFGATRPVLVRQLPRRRRLWHMKVSDYEFSISFLQLHAKPDLNCRRPQRRNILKPRCMPSCWRERENCARFPH